MVVTTDKFQDKGMGIDIEIDMEMDMEMDKEWMDIEQALYRKQEHWKRLF